jgi:hypothetical protein
MNKTSKIAVVNISSNEYLPNQSLFTQQLKQSNPDLDVFCITLENSQIKNKLIKTIRLKDVTTIDWKQFVFKYQPLELATAVKPFVIRWLMDEYGYEKVLYFDSDILVYKSLAHICNKLDKHDVVLTPHIREMISDDKLPHEIDFTKSGYFNLGFIGFSSSDATRQFLKWWEHKLKQFCIVDFDKFYFVDQRWIDYAPIFLNSYIIKRPGYNVSYFNLQEYVGIHKPSIVIFMHFSGFDIKLISKHQNRFTPDNLGEYYPLFLDYQARLSSLKKSKTKDYIYSHFSNGVRINNEFRRVILDDNSIEELNINHINTKNPFNIKSKRSIFNHLCSQRSSSAFINAFYYIYTNSDFLKQKFPEVPITSLNPNLLDLIQYMSNSEVSDLKIDPIFIKKQKQLLNTLKPAVRVMKARILGKSALLKLPFLYISIIKLSNSISFLNNLYYFLLNRFPESSITATYSSSSRFNSKKKQEVINGIISSDEYNLTKHFLTSKLVYRLLSSLYLK